MKRSISLVLLVGVIVLLLPFSSQAWLNAEGDLLDWQDSSHECWPDHIQNSIVDFDFWLNNVYSPYARKLAVGKFVDFEWTPDGWADTCGENCYWLFVADTDGVLSFYVSSGDNQPLPPGRTIYTTPTLNHFELFQGMVVTDINFRQFFFLGFESDQALVQELVDILNVQMPFVRLETVYIF